MPDNIQNYITTLKEFYKRIETFNFEFPEYFEDVIIKFFEPIKILCAIGSGNFPVIERVTVNKRVIKKNLRIYNVDDLKYPPPEYVKKFGRVNLKGQSVLYGTFNFMTAIKEMKPDIDDLITVSEWSLKNENDNLTVCPIFMRQPKDGTENIRLSKMYNSFMSDLKRFPPEISRLIFEIHIFYANCFARKIDSNNHQGYIFTAVLSDKILTQYNGGIVEAILYPSTQEELRTENIAIKKDSFDMKYELRKTAEKRLIEFSENRDYYKFELSGESDKIDGKTISWK